jgi:pullulanase/glycogen debranching enzyme
LALVATLGISGPAWADCDDPAFETVLAPAPAAGTTALAAARAHWLDGTRIRWPGAPARDRYRLYHSAAGRLQVGPDARVVGADDSVDLDADGEPLAPELADRFRYVASGAALRIPAATAPLVREWLRGQVAVARESNGRVLDVTALQPAGALDDLYAPARAVQELGAQVAAADGRTVTRFAVWAPTARNVKLCLYPDDASRATAQRELHRDDATGVWSAEYAGDLQGTYYRYVVDVHVRGAGVLRNRVTDPYSLGLGADGRRSYVARLDAPSLKPPGWDGAPRPAPLAADTDMAIYELHVRDFSRDDATVPMALRGRYLAFAADSLGTQRLRELARAGITDVHLLPAYDLSTVPERGCVTPSVSGGPADESQQAAVVASAARDCFNWGYDPLHYTVPDGSYSTDAADAPRRIVEFRTMVQALHRAGLRVGMDVVYNHTVQSGRHPDSVLDRIVPDYYHRLDANGDVEKSTCCSNTATEHAMMAKLMVDSVVVWARDYRVDSFRFDLMGHQPRAAMLELQARVNAAAGRRVQLIGEGWNFGEVADGARFVQASQRELGGTGIGTFSDRARDAVRGGGAGDRGEAMIRNRGWATGLALSGDDADSGSGARDLPALRRAADLVRVGLAGTLRDFRLRTADGRLVPLSDVDYAGQPAGYASAPNEVVNYVENHDNHTLFDAGALKLPPEISREDRARVQVLALATVAFSQGIAYFHAGGELLRSKSLDRNSYDSGDAFNRLDWSAQSNGFGRGLPPKPDNGADWPLLGPRLADPRIAPEPAQIDWTRRAFLDLLRIRASSTLFRLRTATDVRERLTFPNAGPEHDAAVIVARLDGRDYAGARFREIVYVLNASDRQRTVKAPTLRGRAFRLHPVHLADGAADARAREARIDPRRGEVHVPPLSAVVFVR